MTYRALHTAALIAALAPAALAEDRALIIGIEGYPNLDLRLAPQSATDDAIAMAQLAVERWGYRQTQVSLLLDSAATSEAILDALIDELVGLTTPGDRALLYFAGLGSRNTQDTRVILAYDSESLLGRIPEDALSDILDLIADRDVTVIMDTGFRGDINTPGQRGIGAPGFEAAPFAANGDLRAVFTAAAVSQTAWETALGGVMTNALITGAKGAADADADGTTTHGELLAFLRAQSTAWCAPHPDCGPMGLTPGFAGPLNRSATGATVAASAPAPQTSTPFAATNAADLRLAIDGGTALTIGQSVTFRATAQAAGTLLILDVDPNGQLARIFPSALAPGSGTEITPGVELAIPSGQSTSGAPLRVRVTGPAGDGYLLGVLIEGAAFDATTLLPQGAASAALPQLAQNLSNLGRRWSAMTLNYTISN
ncbi:DUF4384 domain-containing protein [Yoonia sp. R2331]|uniref:DUF4384 domain-containing protein n=1 Tax=Yoonia sp. R2331 TaxID=3237238 RepID=UPI0034E55290